MGTFSILSLNKIMSVLPVPFLLIEIDRKFLSVMVVRIMDLMLSIYPLLGGFCPSLEMMLGVMFDQIHRFAYLLPHFPPFL